jgi:hypothetical protein
LGIDDKDWEDIEDKMEAKAEAEDDESEDNDPEESKDLFKVKSKSDIQRLKRAKFFTDM